MWYRLHCSLCCCGLFRWVETNHFHEQRVDLLKSHPRQLGSCLKALSVVPLLLIWEPTGRNATENSLLFPCFPTWCRWEPTRTNAREDRLFFPCFPKWCRREPTGTNAREDRLLHHREIKQGAGVNNKTKTKQTKHIKEPPTRCGRHLDWLLDLAEPISRSPWFCDQEGKGMRRPLIT